MTNSNALITGVSSGLGEALAETLLKKNHKVYGCSRRARFPDGVIHRRIDLTKFDEVAGELDQLTEGVERLEMVILNAGILGQIRNLADTPLEELKAVMDANVWANKIIMDWLRNSDIEVTQVVMISSGASRLGNHGWSGYALSKAALNMLAMLYSHEFPDTHICALAPGIIDTAMMD